MNVAWTGHRPELFAQPEAVARSIAEIAARLRAERGANSRLPRGGQPGPAACPHRAADHGQELPRQWRGQHGADLRFHCGGQRGVDTWAADAAERLGIPLSLYLPTPIDHFAADWGPADRAALERTWAYASERTVVDPTASLGAAAYRQRNALLAQRCDLLLAVWTGRAGGGTAETIDLARRLGRPIREFLHAPSADVPAPGERGI